MQDLSVFETYQFMSDNNIFFAYAGTFDHFSITSLLKSIKGKLNALEIERGIAKKIQAILIEKVENIRKHSSHDGKNTGLLLLCKSDTKYIVITGNQILHENVPSLQENLERLSKLSMDELKQEYKEQLLSERTNENGAGLGLLDILIKSANPLKYDFRRHTDVSSFCIIQTEINI
jgi:hypothetical protein